MITRRYHAQRAKSYPWGIRFPFRWLGSFLLGIAISFGTIALTRSCQENAFPWFSAITEWHQEFANYLRASSQGEGWILCLIVLLIAQALIRLSPQPRAWSRLLIVAMLLALVLRYILWRSLATLNFSSPVNGITSLVLFGLEMVMLTGYSVQLFLMMRERDRRREADRYAVAVNEGLFQPSVDVLIPTYNEPVAILRRTVIGCQAMNYANKQVYLLDDGDRPEVRQLARELGCHYISRPSNRHAKAGNLNYAIARTHGDLIVVFDADFIPTKNFLSRTVGFFQNRTIGMVQTHQCFYNPDPLACNLGIEKEVPHENEIFARHYQLIRDGANSALCYGSSFVVRRDVLAEAGGFVTRSVSEDLYTGIRIAALGYQIVYLDENLSAGLVPEDMPSQILQRQRWSRGSIQAFFMKENPLTIPGLTWRQRIAYMEGIFQWFNSPIRIVFMILPISVIFFGIVPFTSTLREWIYYFLPLYVAQVATLSWLNHRASAAFAQEIYAVATCFPIAATVLQTLFRPFARGFQVTPKGASPTDVVFQWKLAAPLMGLSILTILSFLWQSYHLLHPNETFFKPETLEFFKLGLVWSGYNLVVLGLVIRSLFDIPKLSIYYPLQRCYPIKLHVGDRLIEGRTNWMSEVKTEISLSVEEELTSLLPGDSVVLHIPQEALILNSRIVTIEPRSNSVTMQLAFEPLSPEQYRTLVELLFCTPGQWQRQLAPGELQMLGLLLRSLLRPQRWVKRAGMVKRSL